MTEGRWLETRMGVSEWQARRLARVIRAAEKAARRFDCASGCATL